MVYQWKRNMPVDANTVGQHLEKLEKKHGKVTSQIVLDDARSKQSCLHDCFEWDDSKAAENYRLGQARFILQNLTVYVEKDADEPPTQVRAFVNIQPVTMKGNQGAFVSVRKALSDDDTRAIVLRNALAELSACKRKYADLEELQEVFSALDNVIQKVA